MYIIVDECRRKFSYVQLAFYIACLAKNKYNICAYLKTMPTKNSYYDAPTIHTPYFLRGLEELICVYSFYNQMLSIHC